MRIALRYRQQHVAVDLHPEGRRYRATVDGSEHVVECHHFDETTLALVVDGQHYLVDIARNGAERLVAVGGEVYAFMPERSAARDHTAATLAAPQVLAPMPGKVLEVLVQPGDHVEQGDGLLILEAMKMENRLVAEAPGTVVEVRTVAGSMVEGGQVLLVLAYDEDCR